MFTRCVHLKSIQSSLVSSLHNYTSQMSWGGYVNALIIILRYCNIVPLQGNLKDLHLFHSIKLWPQGDRLAKNPRTPAVWLMKCCFNSLKRAKAKNWTQTEGCTKLLGSWISWTASAPQLHSSHPDKRVSQVVIQNLFLTQFTPHLALLIIERCQHIKSTLVVGAN